MQRKILTAVTITIAAVAIVLAGFYQFFFLRLPSRNIPGNESVFVSPANGTVCSVTHWTTDSLVIPKGDWGAIKVLASDLGKSGTMIGIHLDLGNVHYQRIPAKGFYLKSIYVPGAFHNALSDDNQYGIRFENEHNIMLFESAHGTKYKVIQIAGFLARRIVDDLKSGRQPVDQGQVYGLIKMGSQVSILFPENVKITIKKGDVLIDGETVIGKDL